MYDLFINCTLFCTPLENIFFIWSANVVHTTLVSDDTKEAAVYLTAINNAGASDPILRTYKPLAGARSYSAIKYQ